MGRKKYTREEVAERIASQLVRDVVTGCWVWQGYASGHRSGKYGRTRWEGRSQGVHRILYEIFNGPIPEGLVVRHRCRNTLCANPEHLKIGTHGDNMKDRARDSTRPAVKFDIEGYLQATGHKE